MIRGIPRNVQRELKKFFVEFSVRRRVTFFHTCFTDTLRGPP
jgi:hypothetical protein